MDETLFKISLFGATLTVTGWKLVGYLGAALFTGRWFVQMIASRKHKRSTMPIAFWYMSICGSILLLSYFIFGKNDSVGILTNLLPTFVASYNLMLELTHRRKYSKEAAVPSEETQTFELMNCYLDNNATTAVDPEVLEEMLPFLKGLYGNPSSGYGAGVVVKKAVEQARERLATLLGCAPEEVLFTSCGTESNNSAIWSALQIDPDRQHVVTTAAEHSAIIKQCEYLAKRGVEITWLRVDANGLVDLEQFEKALRSDTAIASVMWANNETGVLSPVVELAEIARRKGVLFHTDAVQAVGKLPIRLTDVPVSFLSVSGHKLHCPKGVGALYIRNRTRFVPMLRGGSQENGRRAGTENVASIVALGKAAELALAGLPDEETRVRAMRDRFEHGILARVEGCQRNGHETARLPNTSNLSFDHVDSEGALMLLDQLGVCCSAGSACTAGSIHPSHVLSAMGHDTDRARGSLRFSFSRFNTEADVDKALKDVTHVIGKLRSLHPKSGALASAQTRSLAEVGARAE